MCILVEGVNFHFFFIQIVGCLLKYTKVFLNFLFKKALGNKGDLNVNRDCQKGNQHKCQSKKSRYVYYLFLNLAQCISRYTLINS